MSNYFKKVDYLSNSTLSKFGQELCILPEFSADEEKQREAFRLGTLFDVMATENERLDMLNGVITGTDYTFNSDDLSVWSRKQKKLYAENFYKVILSASPEFQKEVYVDNFTLDGFFYVKFKGKLDVFLPGFVVDLKTTSATSQQAFEYTCNTYGYYRQMIYYMALTGANKSLLIGVCKSKDKVFKVPFDAAHPLYAENLAMCRILIQKYCIIN